MRLLLSISLCCILVLASCNNNKSNRKGELYLQTYFVNSLSINWIWLGDDGTIVFNPQHGVDPVNIKKEKETNEENVGEYEIDGDEILVTWENGKKSKLPIEKKGGDITAIDGGLVTVQDPLPNDFSLNGKFEGSTVFGNLANINTYYFKKDGRFSLNRFGAVSTEDVGASSEDDVNGEYTVKGNTITLEFDNGEKKVAVIGVFELDNDKNYIIMNQTSFPQRADE